METDIFDTIEIALALAGYVVLDGDGECIIIRHKESDTDYEIQVNELVL